MATEQVKWPDDIPFTGIPLSNFEGGDISTSIEVRIFLDRNDPGSGAIIRNNFISLATQDPVTPSNKLESGSTPLDELWCEVRFTADATSTLIPYITEWTKIGANTILPFPEMTADTYRTYEIRFKPPSYALTNPYTFFVLVHASERAIGLQGPVVDSHRGILDGYHDSRQRTLLSGSEVTAQAIADDTVDVSRGHMIFDGVYVGFLEETLTIDDLDDAAEPLEIGEAYFVMMSRNSDGSIDQVKGLRSDTPIQPVKDATKLFFAYVRIDYTGAAPVIDTGDIEMTTFWGHYYLTVQTGLFVRIHGGNLVSSGTWRTTFEFEDVGPLTPSVDNYIWSRADGSLSVTTDAILPDASSDLLYKITTDATDVTAVEDRRKFAENPLILDIAALSPATAPNPVAKILHLESDLQVYKIIAQLDSNPGAGTNTIFDVLVNGTTIYPVPGPVDTRPTFLPGTVDQIDIVNHHLAGTLERGDVITLQAIQYSGGTQPGNVRVFFYCK